MIFFGFWFNNCLTISDPMDPPAPVTKNSRSSGLAILSSSVFLPGIKSSMVKFWISDIFFSSKINSWNAGTVLTEIFNSSSFEITSFLWFWSRLGIASKTSRFGYLVFNSASFFWDPYIGTLLINLFFKSYESS